MERRPSLFALVPQAALKLGKNSPEWSNLLAFLQSCYTARPRRYDHDRAMSAMARLSEAEQHALIAWTLFVDEQGAADTALPDAS